MEVQEEEQHTNQIGQQLKTEKESFVNAQNVLDEAIVELQNSENKNNEPEGDGNTYTDIMSQDKVKLTVRVRIPEKEHPNYNFIGKLIGPKGSTMKQLQADTGTRISIMGRNSMRDKEKEEALRNGMDPKYSHLTNDLHVMIEAHCPSAEAYSRIGYALTELKKYLIPDPDDEIRQGQMMEMGMIGVPPTRGGWGRGRGTPGRGMVRPPMGTGPQVMPPQCARGGLRGAARGRGVMPGRGRAVSYQAQQNYETPYEGSYKNSYEDTTGKAIAGTSAYGKDGVGGYINNTQTDTYGVTPSSGGNPIFGGYRASGSTWGNSSGGIAPRMKTPSQGYAMKPTARSYPYARY